jgi:hypothetical protein
LYRINQENPLRVLPDISGLFEELKPERYAIGYKNGKIQVGIEVSRKFPNLVDLNLFFETIKDRLSELKRKGFNVNIGEPKKDIKDLELTFTILLEKQL